MPSRFPAAVFAALAFAGSPASAAPAGPAASEVAQPWAETSSMPKATPAQKRAGGGKQQRPAERAGAARVIDSGEASGSVDRPQGFVKTRAQVRQEARAARGSRRTADGWEQVGGESRSSPR